MLTKKEAAEYLQTSERSIERMVSGGKLAATYERGARKPVPMFRTEDLDAVRVVGHAATVKNDKATGQDDNSDSDTNDSQSDTTPDTLNDNGTAIVSTGASRGEAFAALVQIATAAATEGAIKAITDKADSDKSDIVPIADRLTLDLDGAALLSGFSKGVLRTAIGAGELPARKIGRGWKVERSALEEWVKSLF